MEHLDSREGDQETCEYTIIGGKSCNLVRVPSTLQASLSSPPTSPARSSKLPEGCPRCGGRGGKVRKGSRGLCTDAKSPSIEEGGSGAVSRSSSACGDGLGNPVGPRWDEEDVVAWLGEVGMACYEVSEMEDGDIGRAWE